MDSFTTPPGHPEPLPGVPDPGRHLVLGTPMRGPWPEGTEVLSVAMGCFWGAERIFWKLPGVVTTAVGYQGGSLPSPTYEQVCTGATGHAEAVLVAYDPVQTNPEQLLKAFWENHDPTTLNRQGNDVGSQYRSAIFWTTSEQEQAARATRDAFEQVLTAAGHAPVVTELRPAAEAGEFFYAEDYHQQYLQKNPGGYCNHGPNGYSCPVGLLTSGESTPAQTEVLPPR
ncbi:peptide-methionine (S)-S-oxide reductase MsrA [Ornithinimicrobium pratense]|uniref:Peptide methionine sulfoxide reductase MsrA n=1 Tax=Ornithinimicrobium pratense TaxID=2593973 RepID=A0A5J6V1S8_9MICO|nr:peptide-methionine (S)-S-oxide reductase MsrA [Ornithinimicrobium pratense]QFG67769.1 peptide-methionine (S)-S-oxide reductase MsrA [Ornithinimicrobium pratense]